MMSKTLVCATMCVAALSGAPAMAAIASDPTTFYEVRIGGTTTDYDTAGSYHSTLGSVTTQASPMPALRTQAAVGDAREDANAYMRYYYRISGPENVLVPISLAGQIHLTAQAGDTAQGNAFGQVDLPTVFTSDFATLEIDRGGTVRGSVSDLIFDLHGTVYTNGWNSVILRSSVVAGGSRLDGAQGTSYVDPILRIDPSFFTGANAGNEGRYTLSFSNGVTNDLPGGVPEPASWALLIVGFGLTGSALRERRAIASTAALT